MSAFDVPKCPVFWWLRNKKCSFVLAQVHGDPLFRNREIKKLECFSKKRFGELKKAVRVLGRRKIIK